MTTTKIDRLMDVLLPALALMNKEELEEASDRINNTIDVFIMKQ